MKSSYKGHYITKILASAVTMLVFLLFLTGSAYADVDYPPSTGDLTVTPATEKFVTTVSLNLRSGPSTIYDRLDLLSPGTVVNVTNFNPYGFSAVTVNGVSGYVSSEFIRRYTPRTGANASFPKGTVEMLTWNEVRNLMPLGSTIQVYDVRTGKTYNVRNFSNGRHADVEAITQADTQTIRAANGGRWSWDPRPVLVTWPAIEGRVIAASIHSMPHAGSTISGNGMNGHICIHFLGVVNNNPTWGAQMQAAVREAYNSAR